MSVAGIHWAQQMRGVCPFKKSLLYALGERHLKDSGLCIVDQVQLAQDAGMSLRTVRKYLQLLETDGLIERTVKSKGVGLETHYRLRFDRRTPQKPDPNRQTAPDPNRQDLPVGTNRQGRAGTNRHLGAGSYRSHEEHEDSVSSKEDTAPGLFSENEMGPPKPAPPAPRATRADRAKAELATSLELQKAQIFAVGTVLLKKQGMAEKRARGFLGGLIKRSSVEIVARIMNSIAADPPLEAQAYLSGAVSKAAARAGLGPPATDDEKARQRESDLAALDRRMAHIATGGLWAMAWGKDPRLVSEGVPPALYEKHGIPPPAPMGVARRSVPGNHPKV